MKFTIDNKSGYSAPVLMKKVGYVFDREDEIRGEESFTREMGPHRYPRFHIYLKELGERIECNIHLDQNKNSYSGTTAHAGEYDGDLVHEEVIRIQGMLGTIE
jgi:hypothetical protein